MGGGASADQIFHVGDRGAAVDLRFTGAEHVQVGAVKDQDTVGHGGCFLARGLKGVALQAPATSVRAAVMLFRAAAAASRSPRPGEACGADGRNEACAVEVTVAGQPAG